THNRTQDFEDGEEWTDLGPFTFAFDQLEVRFVLRGVMLDAQAFAGKLSDQFSHGLAFMMQVRMLRTSDGAILSPVGFDVAAEEFRLAGLEPFQLVIGCEIMHGFVVAFADFDQVRRKVAGWGTFIDKLGEINALTAV